MTQNLIMCASFDVRKYIKQNLYATAFPHELFQRYAWELIGGGRMKIEMPVQVNIPVEEVIEYLKKDGTLVEVVRCKDCKYRYTTPDFCNVLLEGCRWACEESPDDDDFCSYGERKESEE